MSKKYALIIGNSTYEDHLLTQLNAPKFDVDRFAKLLEAPEIGNFSKVDVLKDGEFANIRIAIADLFAEKEKDDLVLLYFSGHGIKDERGVLHLAVKDTQVNRLGAKSIESNYIRTEMENSRARRQVIILDCCFSGAFSSGFKGADTQVITNDTFATQGYGKVILTASNSTQYAFEGDRIIENTKNSLFTHYLLEGLEEGLADLDNNGIITVDEWYQYAYTQIESSDATQRPRMFVDAQEGSPIEIASTMFVGSYLTPQLLPAAKIEKEIGKVITYLAKLPILSLLPDEKQVNNQDILNSSFIVEGDNLLAMKAIFSRFASKTIKCVYIDPPYNSGIDKVKYQKNLFDPYWSRRKLSPSRNELHEPWIQMMYPRLIMIYELMADDGVIFVSIDDMELNSLKWLMDNIFGSINWICTFVWKKNKGLRLGNHFGTSIDHEYIVCYSRGPDFHFKGIGKEIDATQYANPDHDSRGPWKSASLIGLSDALSRPDLSYEIKNPETGETYKPPSNRGWRLGKEKMNLLIGEGQIVWPKSLSGQPRQKRYIEGMRGSVLPLSSVIDFPYLMNSHFDAEGGVVVSAVKPVELVKLLINQIPGSDFTVLDAFAGSGTTGQAVIDLNNDDGGKRKFILMENDSKVCRQIMNKRLEDTIEKLDAPLKEIYKFSFFTLGEPKNV